MTTEKQTPAELAEEIKQFIASEFGITGGTLHSKINQLAALASAPQVEPMMLTDQQVQALWVKIMAGPWAWLGSPHVLRVRDQGDENE